MNATTAIWADSLTKIYRSGDANLSVFKNLSLIVPKGERLAIIGESGAGKSTLLHLLGGLDYPTSGRVLIGNSDLSTLNRQALANLQNTRIAFVWQTPSLLPEFSALENVAMPLLIRGLKWTDAAAIARDRLTEVGLAARLSHRPGELSGGEAQRVALARALAAGPQILLADEPTGSLDSRTGESIVDVLFELHAIHGLTSIFVTHNVPFARRCDRILELKNGQFAPIEEPLGELVGVIQDATRLDGGPYV